MLRVLLATVLAPLAQIKPAKLPISCTLMRKWIIFTLVVGSVYCIPVDNGVEGEPEIECGSSGITVNFNTRNPFEGHVYVKGLFDQPNCRNEEHGRQVAGIEIPFDQCNTARTRSLNPKGVFVSNTVVISFHPQFVTKVDRAYRIQCFYMEADKTVSTQIEVSDLTTAFQTQIVPMPVCKYEILDGGPTGQPIQFATIGQQVYHKWTCDSETTDTFCAVVHTCTVDDGNGDTVQILNEEGCALDRFLLNNLEYPTDLMAGQEAHVYKYADRAQLFYQCQISITIKESGNECPRPQCPEPQGFGAIRQGNGPTAGSATGAGGVAPAASFRAIRQGSSAAVGPSPTGSQGIQRLLRKRSIEDIQTLDVRTEINTIDISPSVGVLSETIKDVLPFTAPHGLVGVCFSPAAFSLLASGIVFLTATVGVGIFWLVKPRKHRKS